MKDKLVRLSDVRDIPDMLIGPQDVYAGNGELLEHTNGWQPLDLADPKYAAAPDPPAIHGMLYARKRHVLSGPPESAKTLIAYLLLLSAMRDGWHVAIIDFEMGPTAARQLLHELGATQDELTDIYYVEPSAPPNEANYQALIGHEIRLVLLDAAIGAYDAQGLDDNKRQDAEKFAGTWTAPLWQAEIATLLIDHVVKNVDGRGKYTIGSERKLGGADVHLGLEALKTLSRGGSGLIKVHVHKDRPGYMPRPSVAVLELASDPDTHHISWQIRDPHPVDEEGAFKPTIYMERVSRELEKHDDPLSRNQIEEAVQGKRDYVRDALDHLVADGYVSESVGPRNARMFASIAPYRKPPDDLAPTSPPPRPGEDIDDFAPTPLTGVSAGRGQSDAEATSPRPGEIDVFDPAVQRMLDDDIPF